MHFLRSTTLLVETTFGWTTHDGVMQQYKGIRSLSFRPSRCNLTICFAPLKVRVYLATCTYGNPGFVTLRTTTRLMNYGMQKRDTRASQRDVICQGVPTRLREVNGPNA